MNREQLKRLERQLWSAADNLRANSEGKRFSVDRGMKELKSRLERLHSEIRNAESFFSHVAWLHERSPSAKYEEVTGLCKSADLAEIKEQDYSLNPGRYVGVAIEEDGETEEEFIEGLAEMQTELETLVTEATELSSVIRQNVNQLIGDA